MCRPNQEATVKQKENSLRHGFAWGSASMGLWFLATSIGMPYMQDKRNALGCDSMCQGSMNATKSTLTLLGASLLGRVSDAAWLHSYGGGRRLGLWLGLLATALGLICTQQATSLPELWQSLWPQMGQQNASLLKALFSDLHTRLQSSPSERASTAGLLGMMGGLAMMLGPILGSWCLDDMEQATYLSLLVLLMAAYCVYRIPKVLPDNHKTSANDTTTSQERSFWSLLDIPAARSPPALFLLTCRSLSTLAFHIFSTVNVPSLRARFGFGSLEYGQFFSLVGFFYALSQYWSKYVFQLAGAHTAVGRTRLFASAVALQGLARYIAFTTMDPAILYVSYAANVLASGVVSTLFAADTSVVAPPGQSGAFFGLVTTIESLAGMVGPLVGGSLSSAVDGTNSENSTTKVAIPMLVSNSLVAIVFGLVCFGYQSIVLPPSKTKSTSTTNDESNGTIQTLDTVHKESGELSDMNSKTSLNQRQRNTSLPRRSVGGKAELLVLTCVLMSTRCSGFSINHLAVSNLCSFSIRPIPTFPSLLCRSETANTQEETAHMEDGLLLSLLSPSTKCDVDRMSSTDLAYMGDVVYEMLVRSKKVWPPKRTSDLQQQVVGLVRAEHQADLMERLRTASSVDDQAPIFTLTAKEERVLSRGRNAGAKTNHRKSNPSAYQDATALEALLGYLYITNRSRCTEFLRWIEYHLDK